MIVPMCSLAWNGWFLKSSCDNSNDEHATPCQSSKVHKTHTSGTAAAKRIINVCVGSFSRSRFQEAISATRACSKDLSRARSGGGGHFNAPMRVIHAFLIE